MASSIPGRDYPETKAVVDIQIASREDLLSEAGLDTDGIRAAVQARWPDLLAPRTPLSAAAG